MSGHRQQKVMVPPINLIFKYLQQQAPVQIWLYEQVGSKLEGVIKGFDEFMNIVLDEAIEIDLSKNTRTKLGRIMLKGDNITLISSLEA